MTKTMQQKLKDRGNPVFVYGTLLKGQRNNPRMDGGVFMGKWQTVESYLMSAGSYRGSRMSVPYVHSGVPVDQVKGELYFVDDDHLAHIDLLEGHPTWYHREGIWIQKRGAERMKMKAYIYFNERTQGKYHVEDGDFARFNRDVWEVE